MLRIPYTAFHHQSTSIPVMDHFLVAWICLIRCLPALGRGLWCPPPPPPPKGAQCEHKWWYATHANGTALPARGLDSPGDPSSGSHPPRWSRHWKNASFTLLCTNTKAQVLTVDTPSIGLFAPQKKFARTEQTFYSSTSLQPPPTHILLPPKLISTHDSVMHIWGFTQFHLFAPIFTPPPPFSLIFCSFPRMSSFLG